MCGAGGLPALLPAVGPQATARSPSSLTARCLPRYPFVSDVSHCHKTRGFHHLNNLSVEKSTRGGLNPHAPPLFSLRQYAQRIKQGRTQRTLEYGATHAGIKRCCEDPGPGGPLIANPLHLHTNATQGVMARHQENLDEAINSIGRGLNLR